MGILIVEFVLILILFYFYFCFNFLCFVLFYFVLFMGDCCMLVGSSNCCGGFLWIARLAPYHRCYGLGKLSWLTSGL